MSPFNRREFLKRGGAAVVAAGVVSAVPAALPAVAGAARPKGADQHDDEVETGGQLDQPLVAHVRDLETGEIGLFYGDHEVTYRDPKLAARLYRATR